MTTLAFLSVGVAAMDLLQRLVDWVYRKWGQQITPHQMYRDGWFTFGALDTGDLLSNRFQHWWWLKLPSYDYRYQSHLDEYRWSQLVVGWWRGEFRHYWSEVQP